MHLGTMAALFCWLTILLEAVSQAESQSSSQFQPCGNVRGMCKCFGNIANCSRNYGDLQHIPRFASPITNLIFSFNALLTIQSDTFFDNVTGLTDLDLSDNRLTHVSRGAFSELKHLKSLRIGDNYLNYSSLEPVFHIPTLERLDLTFAGLGPLPDTLFYNNPMPRLEVLFLNQNLMMWLNMSVLKPLPKLKYLSVKNSAIVDIYSDHLPILEHLDMSENDFYLETFPATCDSEGRSFFQSLVQLNMGLNHLQGHTSFSSEPHLCLPRLEILRLDFNPIMELNMTIFLHLLSLRELYLGSTDMTYLHPASLSSLRKLDVNTNSFLEFPVTCTVDGQSFYPALSYLDMGANDGEILRSERGSCLPKLTELILDFADIQELNMTLLKPLTNLRRLRSRQTQTDTIYSDFMPSLEKLSLKANKIKRIPATCSSDGQPLFPNLSSLDLGFNDISSAHWDFGEIRFNSCLPRLTSFNLESNKLQGMQFMPSMFSATKLPVLKNLNLKNAFWSGIRALSVCNPSLQTLDLSQNNFRLADLRGTAEVFKDCVNLSRLDLSFNNLNGVSPRKLEQLLSPLKSLQTLLMVDSKLNRISKNVFKPLQNIVEIHLQDNKLSDIPAGTFDGFQNLSVIRLDGNSIASIADGTFGFNTISRLKTLNLSHNPFECTCALLWFHRWTTQEPTVFDSYHPYSRYNCSNILGVDLATFFSNEQKCLLSRDASVLIISGITLFIAAFVSGTVFYRYRWRLRLALYEVFRGDPRARWRQRRPEDFQFDLFVSYDSEDSHWVLTHLLPVLEDQMELRLCAHQRDFIPGKNITDNIVDCLEKSKRVLALFSPNFADSQWCQFELEMCLSHVVDGDDVMVIVMLAPVPARDMSGAMRALMKTTTYIEWADDPEAVPSFWRRMTLALADILPGVNQ